MPRCSLDKIINGKVTTTRSNVKSRSHHDIAQLHPVTNVPTKYQLPAPYNFPDTAQTRFYMSRSLGQGQIKIITLYTYTPSPMFLRRINFLCLTILNIKPGQYFKGESHYSNVKSRSHHDTAHLLPLPEVLINMNLLPLTV